MHVFNVLIVYEVGTPDEAIDVRYKLYGPRHSGQLVTPARYLPQMSTAEIRCETLTPLRYILEMRMNSARLYAACHVTVHVEPQQPCSCDGHVRAVEAKL